MINILQLCKKFPFPLKDGEAIAVTNLSKALQELGCELTLLAMNTSKHPTDINQLPEHFKKTYKAIHAVSVNNDITAIGALHNLLFEREAYHLSRFICPQFSAKLEEVLRGGRFEVVQLETVYLAPYIALIRRLAPHALVVLRSHNVEHEIWQRVAETLKNPFKRSYLWLMNRRLKRFELDTLKDYDILLAITERDARIFRLLGYQNEMVVAPVGLDSREYRAEKIGRHQPLSLSFIGSLDWIPNQEGLRWFLEEVWKYITPKNIQKKIHPIKFHVAGHNAPMWLREVKIPNLEMVGEVEDAKEFIRKHPVIIVPLFSGSGIRVKILESMMLGRVVVTTSRGLEGIAARNGVEVLIADTAEEFKSVIRFCQENPTRLTEIGQAARGWVVAHFDRLAIGQRVLQAYQDALIDRYQQRKNANEEIQKIYYK